MLHNASNIEDWLLVFGPKSSKSHIKTNLLTTTTTTTLAAVAADDATAIAKLLLFCQPKKEMEKIHQRAQAKPNQRTNKISSKSFSGKFKSNQSSKRSEFFTCASDARFILRFPPFFILCLLFAHRPIESTVLVCHRAPEHTQVASGCIN